MLSGNGGYGVDIRNAAAFGNFIQGNFIGLDASGTNVIANALGGVLLFGGAQSNVIGGTSAAARNVISGNAQYGMIVEGASGNVIQGNFIGPDATGKTAPATTIPSAALASGAARRTIFSAAAVRARAI